MIIQDSLLRIDKEIVQDRGGPVELVLNRAILIEKYNQVVKRNEIEILMTDFGQRPELRNHYYHRYQSFFKGDLWDIRNDDDDLMNAPNPPVDQ